MSRRYVITLVAVAGWLVVLSGSGWLLAEGRAWAMRTYDTPEGRAEWRQWQQAKQEMAREQGDTGRPVVISDEPPALVLMRDHFTPIVITSLLVVSMIYLFLVFAVLGSFSTPTPTLDEDATVAGNGSPIGKTSTNGAHK